MSDNLPKLEELACTPMSVNPDWFNPNTKIPYGCKTSHICSAMADFVDFLGFINKQLRSRKMPRLESFLMPANFSSLVGEFMAITIPKYSPGLVKNKFHNGHPDLVPIGVFPNDAILHAKDGIEIKASRHLSGWQGHNPEEIWLLVFVFDGNSSRDELEGIEPKQFRFVQVLGAQLKKKDWNFSGRSKTSRRTITASVTRSGYEKMKKNWIYSIPA